MAANGQKVQRILVDADALTRFSGTAYDFLCQWMAPALFTAPAVRGEVMAIENIFKLLSTGAIPVVGLTASERPEAAGYQQRLGGSGGQHLGESQLIALARRMGAIVWTDDRAAQELAQQPDVDVQTVSTPGMLIMLGRRHRNDPSRYPQPIDCFGVLERIYPLTANDPARVSAEEFLAQVYSAGPVLERNGVVEQLSFDETLVAASNKLVTPDVRFYPDIRFWTALLNSQTTGHEFLRLMGARLVMTTTTRDVLSSYVRSGLLSRPALAGAQFATVVPTHLDPPETAVAAAILVKALVSPNADMEATKTKRLLQQCFADGETLVLSHRDPNGRYASLAGRQDRHLRAAGVRTTSPGIVFELAAYVRPDLLTPLAELYGRIAKARPTAAPFDPQLRTMRFALLGHASLLPETAPQRMAEDLSRIANDGSGLVPLGLKAMPGPGPRDRAPDNRVRENRVSGDINSVDWLVDDAGHPFAYEHLAPSATSTRPDFLPSRPSGMSTIRKLIKELRRDTSLLRDPDRFAWLLTPNGGFHGTVFKDLDQEPIVAIFAEGETRSDGARTMYLVDAMFGYAAPDEIGGEQLALMEDRWQSYGPRQTEIRNAVDARRAREANRNDRDGPDDDPGQANGPPVTRGPGPHTDSGPRTGAPPQPDDDRDQDQATRRSPREGLDATHRTRRVTRANQPSRDEQQVLPQPATDVGVHSTGPATGPTAWRGRPRAQAGERQRSGAVLPRSQVADRQLAQSTRDADDTRAPDAGVVRGRAPVSSKPGAPADRSFG